MFFKIGVLKNFTAFTRKAPVLESLFNKVAVPFDHVRSFANFARKKLKSIISEIAENTWKFFRQGYTFR